MDNVTYIGSGNFAEGTSVSASLSSVQEIEASAFKGTTFTTDISIPTGAAVGSNAFENAKLKKVSYNAETAPYAVYKGATMDSLTLGDSTTEIAANAFQKSKIGGDVLKLGKVKTIEKYAFSEAQLPATVIIPETATYYNNHVFFNVTGGKTLLVYGAYNMVPTALTHGSSFETVVITADIVNNDDVTYGDNAKAHNRLTSMPAGHIIYMTNDTSRINAKVPNNNGAVGVTNGGTFAPSTNFESGKLATPIKDGSKFDGWYTDSDFSEGNKVIEETAISNNTTYYAKWTEVSDYDIAEGDENITLTMTYGETPAPKTASVEVSGGSISRVESSNEAIIEATFEGATVTITAADNLNAGTYAETVYVYTSDGSTHWINVSLTVNKADSTVNPDEDSVRITATYGETITLTAEVAKAQTNGTALKAAQDEVEFLCGKTSLGTALVRYSDDSHTTGTATLTYDTRNGGIPVGTTSTITAVYGGSVNLNGSNTNLIQITLNKINTSIDITPDRTSLTGGGTVTLTVDKSGLPDGAEVNVTCNNGITPSKNADGTWAATLPNSTEDYTFTASYTGDENHNASSDTCTVSVTRRSSGGGGGGGSTTYTVSTDAGRNGDVTVSPSRASYGDTVTITVEPDEGYELDELIVTDSDGDEIDVERVSATRYTFEMPRSRVTVEATFVEITEDPDLLTFTDVPESAYYYDAVYWAVENGVTNGTSASTFSPNASCTRAQMVTFLWRAAGSPEPESTVNPFTDVSASAYYYDAVLWAVEQGITNGTSATTFGPDATVTRGQTVTFLWRYDGSTAVSGSGFADVASDAYYADAVAWAASEGITSGTSATTFSPSNDCTRGQIVTFLYRYMA